MKTFPRKFPCLLLMIKSHLFGNVKMCTCSQQITSIRIRMQYYRKNGKIQMTIIQDENSQTTAISGIGNQTISSLLRAVFTHTYFVFRNLCNFINKLSIWILKQAENYGRPTASPSAPCDVRRGTFQVQSSIRSSEELITSIMVATSSLRFALLLLAFLVFVCLSQ